MEQISNSASERKNDMMKFTRFLGGPNGPKICASRTKTDFKDWGDPPPFGKFRTFLSHFGVP